MSPTCSAVIVQYRGGDEFRRAVEACLANEPVSELIVVCNDESGPELARSLPNQDVRVIQAARNLGFGGAANIGLQVARYDPVLVLNQDVILESGAVQELIRIADQSGAWIVGATLVDPDGQPSGKKAAFPSRLSSNPVKHEGSGDHWEYVPWVTGACMLFTSRELRFDNRLFMYGEDEEVCWRSWRDGGTVAVSTDALGVHIGGTATRAIWSRRNIRLRIAFNRVRIAWWHSGIRGAVRSLYGQWQDRAGSRLSP